MVAFSFFWINIYWYWIFYFISFLLSYVFLYFLWKKKIFFKRKNIHNLFTIWLDDLVLILIIWWLLWWRLWHVFIYDWHYFSHNLLQIFAVWNWWMSFIWWIIWLSISTLILKKIKNLTWDDVFILFDVIVILATFWVWLWRIWNYLNQELYWIVVSNNFMWISQSLFSFLKEVWIFHIYTNIDENLRINTNFISSFFEWFLIFFILIWLFIKQVSNKKWRIWYMSWIYIFLYSFFRFFIEYLKQESLQQYIWFFTVSQYFFILFMVFGIIIVILSRNKKLFL